MNNADYKKALLAELALLEKELHSVGRINPENPNDWEATAEPLTETAELESVASEITDFEDRSALEFELEERYDDVKRALKEITEGTYGICEVCTSPIEPDRLHANPAARTCKAHLE